MLPGPITTIRCLADTVSHSGNIRNDQCHPLKSKFHKISAGGPKFCLYVIMFNNLNNHTALRPRVRRAIHRSRSEDCGEFSMPLHGREGLQHVGGTQGADFHLGKSRKASCRSCSSSALFVMCFLQKKTRRKVFFLDHWWTKVPNRRFDPLSGSASLGTSTASIGRKVPRQNREMSNGKSKSWKNRNCQGFSSQVFPTPIKQCSCLPDSHPPEILKDFH